MKSSSANAFICPERSSRFQRVVQTVITGIDSMKMLDRALEAAHTFKPMSKETVMGLLARTTEAAATGRYELFKTSDRYDGTAHNPQWLG
jgi:ABC-type branched-subunit amino acid transport system substrate-binding protein